MKLLDKFISFVFSIIMLMVSILLILIGLKVVDPEIVNYMLGKTLLSEDVLSKGVFNITTLVGIVLFLASLKTTIFMSLFKVKDRAPISVRGKHQTE